MNMRRAVASVIWPAVLVGLLFAGGASPAAAQGVGDPLNIVAEAEGGTAVVAAVSYGPGQRDAIEALGVTVLVSASPGGPLLASLGQTRSRPASSGPVYIFPGAQPGSCSGILPELMTPNGTPGLATTARTPDIPDGPPRLNLSWHI